MSEEMRKYIEKSEHALHVAEKLLIDQYPADAASKAYYSMFYAAQALLKSESIEVTKHSAVESALGYYFARTGKIPQGLHRMFIDARSIRETADYVVNEEIIHSIASQTIKNAKLFLEEIKKVLRYE
jgi:uncharacterized protein (UPF0332 family)